MPANKAKHGAAKKLCLATRAVPAHSFARLIRAPMRAVSPRRTQPSPPRHRGLPFSLVGDLSVLQVEPAELLKLPTRKKARGR
jgi:hypothetical protein